MSETLSPLKEKKRLHKKKGRQCWVFGCPNQAYVGHIIDGKLIITNCKEHREEGMVFNTNICKEEGCSSTATAGYTPYFTLCRKHAMKKVCETKNHFASVFSLPEKKMEIKYKSKVYCSEKNCFSRGTFKDVSDGEILESFLEGCEERKYCRKHKKEDSVYTVKLKRCECGKTANFGFNNKRTHCFNCIPKGSGMKRVYSK